MMMVMMMMMMMLVMMMMVMMVVMKLMLMMVMMMVMVVMKLMVMMMMVMMVMMMMIKVIMMMKVMMMMMIRLSSSSSGSSSLNATVDENTLEFFSQLSVSGTYGVRVATLSAAGACEARESSGATFSFYLSPSGQVEQQLRQRPRAVGVRLLDSSTALVSWAPSPETHSGSLVTVVSTTCLRPAPSQRMERTYCSEVRGHASTQPPPSPD
ncbi:Receptor-type tyrosine-protein phosphatase O [Liparis tanakae]|uniref:Receptor-type tyrosine-protein phosphatase O n=1 Tax=Liparis tanakae TaxID=230148 RepID=A0A4Z2E5H7_9TELE|nr:Receptor-type tyrosine-protein phosphatase O [Liparis tanakae]